jgi:dipeptidyl aminopeptidase/acylaminoacyl peptidase
MVGNWAAETGPGFNYDVHHWYIGGTPWDNPAEWAKRSSITHVKNITTPSLILHGGSDTQSSVGQSLMFFTAIRDIGIAPVRYIKFPREGHRIHEPRLSRIYQIEEYKWFKKYIDGEDWQPWVRAKSALSSAR